MPRFMVGVDLGYAEADWLIEADDEAHAEKIAFEKAEKIITDADLRIDGIDTFAVAADDDA